MARYFFEKYIKNHEFDNLVSLAILKEFAVDIVRSEQLFRLDRLGAFRTPKEILTYFKIDWKASEAAPDRRLGRWSSNREGSRDLDSPRESKPDKEKRSSGTRESNRHKQAFNKHRADLFDDDVEYVQKPKPQRPAVDPHSGIRGMIIQLLAGKREHYRLFSPHNLGCRTSSIERDRPSQHLRSLPDNPHSPNRDRSSSPENPCQLSFGDADSFGRQEQDSSQQLVVEEDSSDTSGAYHLPADADKWFFDDQPPLRETYYDSVVFLKSAEMEVYNYRFNYLHTEVPFQQLFVDRRFASADPSSSEDSFFSYFKPAPHHLAVTKPDKDSEVLTSERTSHPLDAPDQIQADPAAQLQEAAEQPTADLSKADRSIKTDSVNKQPSLDTAPLFEPRTEVKPAATKQQPKSPKQPDLPAPAIHKPPPQLQPAHSPTPKITSPEPTDSLGTRPAPKPPEPPAPKPQKLQIVVDGEAEGNSLGLFMTRTEKKRQKNKLRKEKKNKKKTGAAVEEVGDEEKLSQQHSQEESDHIIVKEDPQSFMSLDLEPPADHAPVPDREPIQEPPVIDPLRSAILSPEKASKPLPPNTPPNPHPNPRRDPISFKEDEHTGLKADIKPPQSSPDQQPAKKKKKKKNKNKPQQPDSPKQATPPPRNPSSGVSFITDSCKPIPQQSPNEQSLSSLDSQQSRRPSPAKDDELLVFLDSTSEKSIASEVVYLLTLVEVHFGDGALQPAFHVELNRETKSIKIAK